MKKRIHRKGYVRRDKHGRYIRVKPCDYEIEVAPNRQFANPDYLHRKVTALQKFSDTESEPYRQVVSDLSQSCPDALDVIQGRKRLSEVKKTNEFRNGISHAYNILYTK